MRFASAALLSLAAVALLGADSSEPPAPTEPAGESASAAATPEANAIEALDLEARRVALEALGSALAAKIDELAKLRVELATLVEPVEAETQADTKKLIEFYQAMKPKSAAVLLEQLPPELAANVLSAMTSRSAGKILNVMAPARAVLISRLMAGSKR